MKKLLLCGSLLVVGSAFSQYSENFEGTSGVALPAGWTQVTSASDGGYITSTDYTSTYFDFPAHTRYAGTNDDICNCDKSNEKLISSSYLVPAGTSILAFEYVLGQYYGEYANVGISTNGGGAVTDLGTLAATNLSGAHVWTSWSADISSYAGQTINIVWTYNDNADWGSGLMIDDVEVFAPAAIDMEMTALTFAPVVAAGNTTITGTVTNVGASNITSIDVTWDSGSGPNSQTFAVNLNYGDSYNFSHGTPLNAVGGTNYNIDVCVIASGDGVAGNNCMTGAMSTVTSLVNKVTVGEERTGEWCGWCPRGAVALAEMEISNPNDFIGIAVHNGDGMAVASYDGGIGAWIPASFPGGGVDRVVEGDPSTFLAMHNTRVNMVPPASISAVGSVTGNTITVTVTADFVGNVSGDYRLAAVLIEDNVTGTTQSNYYANNSAGPLAYPNGGSMPNFDWAAQTGDVSPVWHDHVGRALGNDQINGDAGSLPGSVSAGSTQSYQYTFTKDAAWKLDDMHVVGMLVNGTTGEILNAGKGLVGDAGLNDLSATNFDVNVAPNPTNGVTAISLNLEEASEVNLVIYDLVGNVVFNSGTDNLAAGSYPTTIDLSGQANGVYFANVSVNGAVKTVKINLTK